MLSCNHCCSGKALSITYCMLVALIIQHAMRMLHIVSCGLTRLQYFSTLSHKRQDFQQKKLLKTKYVLSFPLQLLSETFLIESKRPTQNDYFSCPPQITEYLHKNMQQETCHKFRQRGWLTKITATCSFHFRGVS